MALRSFCLRLWLNEGMDASFRMPLLLRKAVQNARLRHIPRGQILFYEGDVLSEVLMLKEGVVKIYDIDEQGNEKILHIVKPPTLIPYAFFSGLRQPLRWFYTALRDCDLYVMSAPELYDAASRDGRLAMQLTKGFSNDVHELLIRLGSLSKTNARDKLHAALRFLIEQHAMKRRSGWWRVEFAVSHQLLADLCGITRESTAVVMKEFQNEKIIRNPRLTVLEINRDKLFR